jgi:hypothetical protein
MSEGKDAGGKFTSGNTYGKGRPPKVREAALLAIAYEIVNAQTWRQIVSKRVLDAVGKKQIVKDGQSTIVDDERSTAQGRNLAAAWIRDTVIGKPTEYINVGSDDSAYAEFAAYTDEQIAEILATIEGLRRAGGSGSDIESGSAEAG